MRNTILLIALVTLFTGSTETQAQRNSNPTDRASASNASSINATPNIVSVEGDGEAIDTDSSEMSALRRRVEDVEAQNRALLEQLKDLKGALEGALKTKESVPEPAAQAASSPPAAISRTTPPPAQPNDAVRWSELMSEGNRIKFYGFLRLDLHFDSQRPNNSQSPLFITTPDERAAAISRNGSFAMHPRLTRFGIDYKGPQVKRLGDGKLSGKLELDFQNGGTESRQAVRIRHAFLRVDWKDWSLLAGQTWDTVSPLFPTVNSDTLQWNAGNVGDRRPQLRAAYEPSVGRGKLSFTGGVGLTGAIDSLDLDQNGVRDGEESARPNLQARAGYSHPIAATGGSASVGLSGYYGALKTARAVAGRTEFRSQLVNLDFTLPVHRRVHLRGEAWWGRNMSDVRGGAGQGVISATGREVRGRGGWGEVSIKLSRYFSTHPGFSTDDPVDGDLPSGGRTRNRAFFVANRISPNANFLIGADYLRWRTDYKNFLSGVDNRVNIFLQYSF